LFRSAFFVSVVLLGLSISLNLSCGSSSPARQIESISVSPPSADAQNYPDGKVPFVATGTYNVSPMTVAPLQANWGAASIQLVDGTEELASTDEVRVDRNGVAQCAAGASGTYSLGAWVAVPSKAQCTVIGGPFNETACPALLTTAKLTCP